MYLLKSGFVVFLLCISMKSVYAFSCIGPQGAIPSVGGEMDVYVNTSPEITPGANIIFDMSNQIKCRNDDVTVDDYAWPSTGTIFGPQFTLMGFSGGVLWNGGSYSFPLNSSSAAGNKWKMPYPKGQYYYLPLKVFLSPIGAQGGVAVKRGDQIGVVFLNVGQTLTSIRDETFKFIVFSNNDVVVPTGGCDVNQYIHNVALPPFPYGRANIPLTLKCATPKKVYFSLNGVVAPGSNTIIANSATVNSAKGIGFEIKRGNRVVPLNTRIDVLPRGMVGTSPVSLDLSAHYKTTGERISAGNMESTITVVFTYP